VSMGLDGLFHEPFNHIFITICSDPLHFLTTSKEDDHGSDGHLIGGLECSFCVKIQTQESYIFIFRFFPEFVERQDLALANGSPGCVNVDNDRIIASQLFIKIRLIINVELNILCKCGRCRKSEDQHDQRKKLFHG
jgi:hypothetical protein